jgi:hypothetical protein
MKSLALFFLIVTSCLAQTITVEPMPVEEVQNYIGIDPSAVNATKFTATFTSPKLVALILRKTVAGKEVEVHPIGGRRPLASCGVHVFLGPRDEVSGTRTLYYMMWDGKVRLGNTKKIHVAVAGGSEKFEYTFGRNSPLLFSCTSGDEVYTLTLTSKDLADNETKPANQAPVPTPASVTPAAGAPVAPDASAAHL